MRIALLLGIIAMSASFGCVLAFAQEYAKPSPSHSQPPARSSPAPIESPVPLDWTPAALAGLSARAAVNSNFTLDRAMLSVAAGLVGDSDPETRKAINRLDGVSVHLLRFGAAGIPDEAAVQSIRGAYHLRGWKHLVTTGDSGGPVRNSTTDVWFVLDGVNVRGAVILSETAKSITLVTVAGDLSPVDLMHLRGHFGIPRFDSDGVPKPTQQ